MTTSIYPFPNRANESRVSAVARRLRGELAELQFSHAAAGRLIGINPSGMSRRMKGERPWNMDELERLEVNCGVDLDYVLTGRRNAEIPHPEGPDGGQEVRQQGLEPRTRWSVKSRSDQQNDASIVTPIFRPNPSSLPQQKPNERKRRAS